MSRVYPRSIFVLFFLIISPVLFSQNVGINTSATNPSINAILDLNSGNAGNLGLIIPNVSLTAIGTFKPPMANIANAGDVGMMVYNTNAGVGNGIGYYFWNGVNWVSVTGAGGGNTNACGGALANYIPYFTSSTGICNSVIYQASTTTVGVGTITPQNMLDVNGAIAVGTYAGVNAAPAGTSLIASGQVGIGTNSPNATALLDLTSTTQGMLTPRLSTVQIAAVPNLTVGLIVYNTTTNCFEYNYTGTAAGWVNIACPCAAGPGAVGAITGPAVICNGTTGTYSIANVTNATTYIWSSSNTNIAALTSANGGLSATFTGGSTGGNVTITVTASNPCGSTSNTLIIWNGIPATATTPVGPTSPTVSTVQTYTCAIVSGATGYTWSSSNTNVATITTQTSNTCTVTYGASAGTTNICVTPTNICGSGTQACLSVTSVTCGLISEDNFVLGAAQSKVINMTTTGANEIVLVFVDGWVNANRAFSGSVAITGGSASGLTQLINTKNNETALGSTSVNTAVYAFVAATAATYTITVTEASASGMTDFINAAVSIKGFCNTATVAANVLTAAAALYTYPGSVASTITNSNINPTVANSYIATNFCTWENAGVGTVTWPAPIGNVSLGSGSSSGTIDVGYDSYSDPSTGIVTFTVQDLFGGSANIANGNLQVIDVHN